MDLQQDNTQLISIVSELRKEAEDFQESVSKKYVKERYDRYYADVEYYKKKFPALSKGGWNLVTTDVSDTIEWALPSLMKIFYGSQDVVTVQGVNEEDQTRAEVMQEVLTYMLQRKNKFFTILYNWFKDSLITGLGIVKCSWDREEGRTPKTVIVGPAVYAQMVSEGMEIVSAEPADEFGNVSVTYNEVFYSRNQPRIENVLVSEFLYDPYAKDIDDCSFIAHKKKVTISYLRQKELEGVYANVDKVAERGQEYQYDELEGDLMDNYNPFRHQLEEASREVTLYECYVKIDVNDDGILEDMIITLVDDIPLRIEENYLGRHPFFVLSPIKDPHRIWPKRSYADLIGELQDQKIALNRQILRNIALTNDPKLIMSEEALNISDYVNGLSVIRKKAGYTMADSVMPMPVTQLHPWTFQYLEYIESQKENRTGITRYNQGLDASSLNKMLALDTPIPMADGTWKRNKDIIEGDMIIGSDGKPVKVTKAHPIQNPKRAFEITFKNGDVIRAGGEHRWSVKVSDKWHRNKSPEWEKLPTERIFDLMETEHHVYVPRVGPVEFTKKDLPIDPYVFGAWLGDGNAHTNRFTSMDKEVIDAFDAWSKQFYGGRIEECTQQNSGKATTFSIVNTPFRRMLKDLGCLKDSRYEECKDNVKHIPEIYLQGSFEQRLALLRGLMDTDGHIDKNGNAIFCNSEPELVETFVKLVETLGGSPSVRWTQRHNPKVPNARPHAHVLFSLAYCPVTIQRKVERWRTQDKYWVEQAIVSIKEIDIEPMRCLTVEAEDELYCCGNRFTLTSNTATGISQIMSASNQRLELIARTYAETGVVELYRFVVSLIQKFVDQPTVVRLTNKTLSISPDDLRGEFDLDVNAGIGISTKEATMMTLQTFLTAAMQLAQMGVPIFTPQNAYNLAKRWLEEAGMKNYAQFITDPAVVQQQQQMQMMLKQQVLAQMPPEIQALYATTGQLPPEVLNMLPPMVQIMFTGGTEIAGNQPGNAPQGSPTGGFGGPAGIVSNGVVGTVPRMDNRQPQGMQTL